MKEFKSDFKYPLFFYLVVCAALSLSIFTNSTATSAFVIYFFACFVILRLSVFRKAYSFQLYDDKIRIYNQLYLAFPRNYKYADLKRVDLKDHKRKPSLIFYLKNGGRRKYFFIIDSETERVKLLDLLEARGLEVDYIVRTS